MPDARRRLCEIWRCCAADKLGRTAVGRHALSFTEGVLADDIADLAGLRRVLLGMEPHRGAVQRFIQRHAVIGHQSRGDVDRARMLEA